MNERNSREMTQTFYEILEVRQDAPQHEIVRAYEKSKIAYSPESPALYTMFTKEEAFEIRRLIEEAFRVLGNETKRREYDQILLARRSESAMTATQTELPDFGPINETPAPVKNTQNKNKQNTQPTRAAASPSVVANSAKTTSTSTPDGFARSRLGVYEIKQEIENEIKTQTVVDGAFLRKVRTYKNISLDQLCKETRIGKSYIAAVEANDYEALPAPVFVRGFVVQMARLLGLDENKTANSYMELLRSKNQ